MLENVIPFQQSSALRIPPQPISCDVPNFEGANRPINFILQLLSDMIVPIKLWAYTHRTWPSLLVTCQCLEKNGGNYKEIWTSIP
jgi:hypothetical protein